jgi:hypothetical protein
MHEGAPLAEALALLDQMDEHGTRKILDAGPQEERLSFTALARL